MHLCFKKISDIPICAQNKEVIEDFYVQGKAGKIHFKGMEEEHFVLHFLLNDGKCAEKGWHVKGWRDEDEVVPLLCVQAQSIYGSVDVV